MLQILIVVSNYFIYNYRHILISNRFADPVLLRIFRTIILILHISPSQENEGNNGTRRRLGQSVHQISLRYPNLLQRSVVRRESNRTMISPKKIAPAWTIFKSFQIGPGGDAVGGFDRIWTFGISRKSVPVFLMWNGNVSSNYGSIFQKPGPSKHKPFLR